MKVRGSKPTMLSLYSTHFTLTPSPSQTLPMVTFSLNPVFTSYLPFQKLGWLQRGTNPLPVKNNKIPLSESTFSAIGNLLVYLPALQWNSGSNSTPVIPVPLPAASSTLLRPGGNSWEFPKQCSPKPKHCEIEDRGSSSWCRWEGGADIPPQPIPGPLLSLVSIALMEHEFALSKTWSPSQGAWMRQGRCELQQILADHGKSAAVITASNM